MGPSGEYIYDMGGPASAPGGTPATTFHHPAHPAVGGGMEVPTSNAAALSAGSNPLATGRCDLCHGNDSQNMKTGQPELQIACSDCHRTGKFD